MNPYPKVPTAKMLSDFEEIKTKLKNSVVLSFPNFDESFFVTSDASDFGIGASLCQGENIISFASRRLSESERKYNVTKRELLALVFALEKFYPYLYGRQFEIRTDPKPLIYLLNYTNQNSKLRNNSDPVISRWLDRVSAFDLKMVYIPGATNTVADSLSRAFKTVMPVDDSITISSKGRILMRDVTERLKLIVMAHDHGHFSAKDTIKKIYDQGFFWPQLPKEVQTYVKSCHTCLSSNASRPGFNPYVSQHADNAFDHVQIDLLSLPPTTSGNVCVLTMVDVCTRYVILRPLKDKTAVSVAKSLLEIFCNYGFPKIIQSDNGPEFRNEVVKALANLTSSEQRFSTPYYPQSNGIVERFNGTIVSLL